MLPLEFVYIWNKYSGHRIETYVIHGEPGSRCCILNGAAARTCQKGDPIIICAVDYVTGANELYAAKPQVLMFGDDNAVIDHLQYGVEKTAEFPHAFVITNV